MQIVHFKGKVLPYDPAVLHIDVKDLPSLNWTDGQTGDSMTITTKIDASVVDIEFVVKNFDEKDIPALMMKAWDLARAAVDLWCLKAGWGLGVVIDSIVKPDGTSGTLLSKNESLGALVTALDGSTPGINNYDACYRLLVKEPPLFMALNDLIVSITLPHVATVNCARAIEGLRVLMAPAATDRKHAWPILQGNLNIDREYREYVTDISTGPRHGDRTFTPGTVVTETVKRSWIIMNRFLEYRKRGNQALPLAEFPLMTK
jgi:hypothetical protein